MGFMVETFCINLIEYENFYGVGAESLGWFNKLFLMNRHFQQLQKFKKKR